MADNQPTPSNHDSTLAEEEKAATVSEPTVERSGGFLKDRGWQFYTIAGIGVIIALLILILVIGIGIGAAAGKTSDTASAIAIVRDLMIILLVMEGILIGVALIVLVVQLAKLVNILQNEIQPIVNSAQEAVSTVKGTAEFMSKNVTTPAIKVSGYVAGARAFMREISGINRVVKSAEKSAPPEQTTP